MKIKGSVKKLDVKKLSVIFSVIGVIFTALRFYQITALTDVNSGFFTDSGNITVPVYYILWGIIFAGALILFYIGSGTDTGAYNPRRNIPLFVSSLAMGVAAIIYAADKLNELRETAGYLSVIDYVRTEKQYLQFFAVVFAVLSGILFIVDALDFVTGKGFASKLKIVHLCPALWLFSVTVGYFSISVSYLNATQLMLTMFADGMLAVFFYEFAKFFSDTDSGEAPWLLYATGVISGIFLCASALPNLYLTAAGKELVENCPLRYYHLAAILFIAAALFSAATNKNHKIISIDPAEDNEKETESEE